jgi:hypothetical protein
MVRSMASMSRSVLVLPLIACGSVRATPPDATADGAPADTSAAPDAMPDSLPDAMPGPTPRLHWTFDGNTNNSGALNGFALTTPAGISYITGKAGMAASFGTNQYSQVSGIRAVLGSYAKVTIAFWLREPGNLQSQSVFDVINRSGNGPYGGVQLGFAGTTASLCVATATSSLLGGSCGGTAAPNSNTFHHWIIRYDGTSTSSGGGGPVQVYVNGVLRVTRANDANNNPVFSSAIPDVLTIGAPGTAIDDLKIFDQVFDVATQCTQLVGGTYNGATCTVN